MLNVASLHIQPLGSGHSLSLSLSLIVVPPQYVIVLRMNFSGYSLNTSVGY